MVSKNEQKLYKCMYCDYNTSKKYNFDRHLLSRKHNPAQNDKNMNNYNYSCICGNIYKYESGLSRHKKICTYIDEAQLESTELSNDKQIDMSEILKIVLQENRDMIKDLMTQQSEQQNKLIQEIIPKIGNTTNNTQNNQFNINMFLNEKCKDAMNIDDFIEMIEFTDDDMMDSKVNGIENTLNKMIINKLNDIDIYNRPIHCTDIRRETIYVKENGEWSKKNTKDIIKKMIKTTQNKGCTTLLNWRKKNPDNPYGNLDKHDKNFLHYNKVLGQLCADTTKFDDRIIKNICKSTYVKE